LLYYYLLQF